MKKIYSFATGNVRTWNNVKNRNVLLKYTRKLDINGIELTFSSKEELYAFKLSDQNKSWLKSLDYVTIHAPFKLVSKADNKEEIIKQLNIISELYNNINAKNVIIHPNQLPELRIIKNYDFVVSTENLPKKRHITVEDLKVIFNKYRGIKLCIDISHAYLWSKYETNKLVEAFHDKISQIHFSGTYRKKDHQSLRKVTKEFLFSIQTIKELDIPIVIEGDIKEKSLKSVRKEIKCIKRFFNNVQ